jgi:hypothetical protein
VKVVGAVAGVVVTVGGRGVILAVVDADGAGCDEPLGGCDCDNWLWLVMAPVPECVWAIVE